MFEARTFRECLFFELDFELHLESGSRISKSIVYMKITDSANTYTAMRPTRIRLMLLYAPLHVTTHNS